MWRYIVSVSVFSMSWKYFKIEKYTWRNKSHQIEERKKERKRGKQEEKGSLAGRALEDDWKQPRKDTQHCRRWDTVHHNWALSSTRNNLNTLRLPRLAPTLLNLQRTGLQLKNVSRFEHSFVLLPLLSQTAAFQGINMLLYPWWGASKDLFGFKCLKKTQYKLH